MDPDRNRSPGTALLGPSDTGCHNRERSQPQHSGDIDTSLWLTSYATPTIDQSLDVETVTRLLRRSHNCNGVTNERILLWGTPGCGKRRIATAAAKAFAAETGCKILWVEGRSLESFVRDLRQAYTTITGLTQPGRMKTSSMLKIKRALEKRRTEWLMVIFDLSNYLEEEFADSPGSAPTTWLPDWCRILVTSSYVLLSETMDELAVGLQFASSATCLKVAGFNEGKTAQYMKTYGLDDSNVEFVHAHGQSGKQPYSANPLTLAHTCASMRLLRVGVDNFNRMQDARRKKTLKMVWPGMRNFPAHTMSILWDALGDFDASATRLLSILSVLDRLDVPVHLLEKYPDYVSDPDLLYSSINLLRWCGLIEVRKKYNVDNVNMHLTCQRWLEARLRKWEDVRELVELIHGWIDVLMDYLCVWDQPDVDVPRICAEKYWPLHSHVANLCNVKPSDLTDVCSLPYLEFLLAVAAFLVQDGMHSNLAGLAITHALTMSSFLEPSRAAVDEERHIRWTRLHVWIRKIRAAAFKEVYECRLAEQELRQAKIVLRRRGPRRQIVDEEWSDRMFRKLEDDEADLHIVQGNYQDAGRVIAGLLLSPEANPDPAVVAHRHHLMAIHQSMQDLDISALEHSHMCMGGYWRTLPSAQQWGYHDLRMLDWVERHVLTLMCMRKFKGALMLARPLMKRYTEIAPYSAPSVVRSMWRVGTCYSSLDKVTEAESTVCKVLERAPLYGLQFQALTCAIHMLQELGLALQGNGRTVEAEGVFRFILRAARKLKVRNLGNTGDYNVTPNWRYLVMCLLEQGKVIEARRIRDQYQDEDENSEEALNSVIHDTMTQYRRLIQIYEMAIEAETNNTVPEFKALLSLNKTRPFLKRAVKMFGHPIRRIESGRDFASDIDRHGLARARRSRILSALNFNLIYLSFVDSTPGSEPDDREEFWCDERQSVIGQYFKWCECRRKRQRSQSIDPCDLMEKLFITKNDPDPAQRRKKWKQKLITDWITVSPRPKPFLPGCNESCPCVEANKAGVVESEKLEASLFTWKEPTELPSFKPKNKIRYRNAKPNRSPIPENELFTLTSGRDWWWMQSEFASGDNDGENYIIPGAVNIPGISITPPEGQEDLLPLAKDTQHKLTKFYEKDFVSDWMNAVRESYDLQQHRPHKLDLILEDDEDLGND